MRLMHYQNKLVWGGGLAVGLFLLYGLIRFVGFSLHGMKQWPDFLAAIALAFILIAMFLNLKGLGIAAVTGYGIGFALALLFSTEGTDPGGGATSNLWILWGGFFWGLSLIGLIFNLFLRQRAKNQKVL